MDGQVLLLLEQIERNGAESDAAADRATAAGLCSCSNDDSSCFWLEFLAAVALQTMLVPDSEACGDTEPAMEQPQPKRPCPDAKGSVGTSPESSSQQQHARNRSNMPLGS